MSAAEPHRNVNTVDTSEILLTRHRGRRRDHELRGEGDDMTQSRHRSSPMGRAVRTADASLSCSAANRSGLLSGRSPTCGSPMCSPSYLVDRVATLGGSAEAADYAAQRESAHSCESDTSSKVSPEWAVSRSISRSPKIVAGVQKPPGVAALSTSSARHAAAWPSILPVEP
jgi:hypothetical protein